MNQNINLQNIKQTLSSKTYTLNNNGIAIESIFELETYQITDKIDNFNFSGQVNYVLDTEYGGGPVNVELPFYVNNGKLDLNFADVPYDEILNWKEIASESNTTNGYFEDDEDDDDEEYPTEEFDYKYKEEIFQG